MAKSSPKPKRSDNPVLPSFCNLGFYGMLATTAAAVIADISNHFTYFPELGLLHLLCNCVSSAFLVWALFSLLVIPCTYAQLKRGFDQPYFNRYRKSRNGRPRMPVGKRFYTYLLIDVEGLVLLGLAYLLVKLLT